MRAWEKRLGKAFQRNREEAEPPVQWQPTDWSDAAQNREHWKRDIVNTTRSGLGQGRCFTHVEAVQAQDTRVRTTPKNTWPLAARPSFWREATIQNTLVQVGSHRLARRMGWIPDGSDVQRQVRELEAFRGAASGRRGETRWSASAQGRCWHSHCGFAAGTAQNSWERLGAGSGEVRLTVARGG